MASGKYIMLDTYCSSHDVEQNLASICLPHGLCMGFGLKPPLRVTPGPDFQNLVENEIAELICF